MRTVAIIQARMGSTRLPGKVIKEVAGKPLLIHMIERVQRAKKLDSISVAYPGSADNKPIKEVLTASGLDVWSFRGSEDDVLSRVLECAKYTGAEAIVELTADCPLVDPEIIDDAVDYFQSGQKVSPKLALVTTSRPSLNPLNVKYAYPPGMDVRVFSTKNLEYVDSVTKDPVDREHVSIHFWEHQRQFWCFDLVAPPELRDDTRLTVDTPEDLELVTRIFEEFAPRNDFSLAAILKMLDEHPSDLRAINAHIEQKAAR